MEDLPDEALGRIITFAPTDDPPGDPGGRLCSLELVSRRWRSAVRGGSAREAWEVACRRRFPGAPRARTRDDFRFLCSPVAQSAARVVQRVVCRSALSEFAAKSLAPCCVCGVRWSPQEERCELSTCPFVFSKHRRHSLYSKFFVCRPCGERFPERAMGAFHCSHDRNRVSLAACFKCAGECDGSIHGW